MGFRFYRRINILPGVSLNLGKSGASVSVGPRGAKMTFGSRGTRVSVGVPGTGMRYETKIGGNDMRRPPRPKMSPMAILIVGVIGLLSVIGKACPDSGEALILLLVGIGVVGGIVLLVKALSSGSESASIGSYTVARAKSVGDRFTRAMADASLSFYRFLQELDRTPRCREELSETPGLERVGADGDHFTIFRKLAFMVFCDLRDVYVRLGHDTKSLHSREGVGYAMLILLLISKDTDLAWFNDLTRTNQVLKIVEDLSKTDVGHMTIEGHEQELRFALIFGKIHHEQDWVNRYATHLYRWASLVAKANGSISTAESEVLKSIMYLRTDGNGCGVFGNVRITGGNSDSVDSKAKQATPARDERPDKSAYQKIDTTDGMNSLKALIGLEPVKREVRKLASFIDIQRKRENSGLRAAPVSYHCVFTGNPGTGKTTVARILAEIYREMGVVKKGHLVETDRSGLIGEYVGQTAVKTNKIIDTALDGVLFIDEAYSLVQGGEKDYGREAIATLLKRMEDDRSRLVVILAGYTNEMKAFIDSNPGLQSRFNRYIEFHDYNAEELAKIFLKKTEECQYTCDKDVRASIIDVMKRAVETKDKNFGNGRFVRNLFENAIQRQAVRLSTQSPLTAEMLAELTLHDLGFPYEN